MRTKIIRLPREFAIRIADIYRKYSGYPPSVLRIPGPVVLVVCMVVYRTEKILHRIKIYVYI